MPFHDLNPNSTLSRRFQNKLGHEDSMAIDLAVASRPVEAPMAQKARAAGHSVFSAVEGGLRIESATSSPRSRVTDFQGRCLACLLCGLRNGSGMIK
jgi:hypothetical protein